MANTNIYTGLYRKFLLNRVSSSKQITDYIEHLVSLEDDDNKHIFHKIMIHNWLSSEDALFDALSKYFSVSFVPVHYKNIEEVATFYTSSMALVLKINTLDFMFPYQRNMFSIDILFNDKSSSDCFGEKKSIDDIVESVISKRFSENFELDLSRLCEDPGFQNNNINFYNINLLSHFKILMLRMGRDTRILNLSNNNLSEVPQSILNFFIKGDLKEINLSYNNIPSISELGRISSKIEVLWVEGNPLCEDLDSCTYIKQIFIKFPRLKQLDGIKLNQTGFQVSFFKYFLDSPDQLTKMLVEKFVKSYFGIYDSTSRERISEFYDEKAHLSISTSFTKSQEGIIFPYLKYARNILMQQTQMLTMRNSIVSTLTSLPSTLHDLTSLRVDVLKHNKKHLILVVDGVFKHPSSRMEAEDLFQFRRTFIFSRYTMNDYSTYHIVNEMFYVTCAADNVVTNFQKADQNLLSLVDPNKDEQDAFIRILCNITMLKRPEAELRLKINHWDIRKTLQEAFNELKLNKIPADRFNLGRDDKSESTSDSDDID